MNQDQQSSTSTQAKLLRHQIQGRCQYVIFLGAGASVESGGRTGEGVALRLLTRVYGDKSAADLKRSFRGEFHTDPTYENVLHAFAGAKAERLRLIQEYFAEMAPSAGYQLLATLLKLGFLNSIVLTTNHEDMLERALSGVALNGSRSKFRVVVGDNVQADMVAEKDEVLIVKLHGDLNDPDSLRVTPGDTMGLPSTAVNFVRALSERYGLLIIGYRGKDIGILSAITSVTKSEPIYLVTKDTLERARDDGTLVPWMESRGFARNIFCETSFDSFMLDICGALPRVILRNQHGDRIDAIWSALDRITAFGTDRSTRLADSLAAAAELELELDLPEVHAQSEFLAYENVRSGETYHLRQGSEYLEQAAQDYDGWIAKKETFAPTIEGLRGQIKIFLFHYESKLERRLEIIDKVIDGSKTLYESISRRQLAKRIEAGTLWAEALKEKSMLLHDPAEHRSLFHESRKTCEQLMNELKEMPDSDVRKRLHATVLRHLAVSFELEGDVCERGAEREKLYERWRDLSFQSAHILAQIEEHLVRGYALINAGSSLTRLSEFTRHERRRELLDRGRSAIDEAIQCFVRVDDWRGLGWAQIHRCENLRNSISAGPNGETEKLTRELEASANRALARLRLIADRYGLGLAYKELGSALLIMYGQSSIPAITKLGRAIDVLEEAVQLLSEFSYYRAEGETYRLLSNAYFKRAEIERNPSDLANSLESLERGLRAACVGLDRTTEMETVRQYLDRVLKQLLEP